MGRVVSVNHSALVANATLLASFEAAVKQGIADQAGADILPEHVTLVLSAGSVNIEATITPPSGVVVADVKQAVTTNAAAVAQSVTTNVKAVGGIDAVSDPNVEISTNTPTVTDVVPPVQMDPTSLAIQGHPLMSTTLAVILALWVSV